MNHDCEDAATEEDWSHHLQGTVAGKDEDEHHKFSYYDTVVFPLSLPLSGARMEHQQQQQQLCMKLRCVNRLTPLDMLDLSNGAGDATGNRVWMGAVFFLECMVRPLPLCARSRSRLSAGVNTNTDTDTTASASGSASTSTS
eukprot:CAMPEP_0168304484 /NCGR_PEP_ID=MMETSP0142_2-20121227/46871_1 /TAXON_ID=44445 /ORGANISM="Pseudo-nitzschia australis, Strain 10249 10 AB" /LENGTH=141 /DNA_ID=CAMNT_0008255709 /DNA_START=112 /DNA_END=533 /DNA_ORIENTATION=-